MVLISFGMLFVAAAVAYVVVDSDDGNPAGRAFLIAVLILLAYALAFVPLYHVVLWSWGGQTVGMMALHIKVQARGGGRISFRRSALRLLGYAASAPPLFLGVLIALFDRKRRMLHDHLAGTVVVEVP